MRLGLSGTLLLAALTPLSADVNPPPSDLKDAIAMPPAGAVRPALPVPGPRAFYRSPKASVERRVADLLKRMTLEEKLGQLQQLGAGDDTNVAELVRLARQGLVGGTLGAFGAAKFNEVQRA